MNAIEQYRAGMKALGYSDEFIDEKIKDSAHRVLSDRRLRLFRELNSAFETMTDSELLSLVKGGAQ